MWQFRIFQKKLHSQMLPSSHGQTLHAWWSSMLSVQGPCGHSYPSRFFFFWSSSEPLLTSTAHASDCLYFIFKENIPLSRLVGRLNMLWFKVTCLFSTNFLHGLHIWPPVNHVTELTYLHHMMTTDATTLYSNWANSISWWRQMWNVMYEMVKKLVKMEAA